MKILTTGGTGFIGSALTEKLLIGGHQVRLITRDAKKTKSKFPYPVEVFEWDCVAGRVPNEAFDGIDAVIHLLGEPIFGKKWTAEKKKKIYESRVFGTQNLVEGIKNCQTHQIKTFISTSAIGIYGDQKDTVCTEQASLGKGFLSQVCQDWEAEVLTKSLGDVRKAILRIGMVLGNGGGAFQELAPLFYKGVGGQLGSGKQWMSWILLEDLVNLFCETLTNNSYSGVFNATSPNPVTNKAFTKVFSQVIHAPALMTVPKVMLKVAMGEMSQILLESQRVVPEAAIKNGFQFQYPHLKAALETLAPQGGHLFESAQWVPQSAEEVFEFFSSEKNLEKITPPWLKFKVEKKSTDVIQAGTLIDYQLKVHGFPVKWRTEILEWSPHDYFVDNQIKGPYKRWHHRHDFIPMQGGTLLKDRVVYDVPVGLLGEIFAGSLVNKDVSTIFDYRTKIIRKKFGSMNES